MAYPDPDGARKSAGLDPLVIWQRAFDAAKADGYDDESADYAATKAVEGACRCSECRKQP